MEIFSISKSPYARKKSLRLRRRNYYRNCRFEDATLEEQLARLYDRPTIARLGITRESHSNGDGHLPQAVIRKETPTQQALRDLLQGKDRELKPMSSLEPDLPRLPDPEDLPTQLNLLDEPDPAEEQPWMKNRGKTIFI